MNKYTDRIVVKVTLKAPPDENDSSIQDDWAQELHDWVDDNDCEIQCIEWTRYRQRLVEEVSATGRVTPSIKCDVIEQSTSRAGADYGQSKKEAKA
jgi:hypothetical protein